MIDPSIPLQYHPDVAPPDLNQLAAQQQELQQRRLQMQLTGQQIQQNKIQMAQTQALNDAYKNSITTDPTTGMAKVDRDARDRSLINSGHGSLVAGLRAKDAELDKAQSDAAKLQADVNAAHADYAGHIGDVVSRSGYDPNVLVTHIQNAMQNGALDQLHGGLLLKQVQDAMQSDPTGAQAQALTKQLSDQWMQASPAIQKQLVERQNAESEAQRVATAKQAEERQGKELAARLPGIQADSDSKVRAAELLKRIQADPSSLDAQIDAEIDPKRYPAINKSAKVQAKAATSYEGMQQAIAQGLSDVRSQERSIATVQAEAPTRIGEATAIAAENRKGQSQEQARREIVQSQDAVNNAQSVGETIKGLLTAAQNGNATAASQIKVMLPELVNSVQGIKRLSGGQLENTPGSAFDKVQGYLSGIIEGQPIPDRVVKELPGVIDQLTATARRSHNAGVDSRNQAYGTNFGKIEEPKPAAKVFTTAQVHAYAAAHGITDDAAKQFITKSGYTIQ